MGRSSVENRSATGSRLNENQRKLSEFAQIRAEAFFGGPRRETAFIRAGLRSFSIEGVSPRASVRRDSVKIPAPDHPVRAILQILTQFSIKKAKHYISSFRVISGEYGPQVK